MKQTCKSVLSLMLTVAMLIMMVSVCGLTFVTSAAEGAVLFSENFDSYTNGTLPENWTISSDSGYTDVSVQDGKLQINGKGTDAQTRVVYLGSELTDKGDYIFEADYSVVSSDTVLTSSTRYSSMIFRASSSIYPYYYCTTRVRPGTNNELSIRNNSDSSSYKQLSLAAPPAQQVIGETYHLKVICRGANVQYYIDDALIFNFTLETTGTNYSYLDKGTIGFTTSNLTVTFDNIVVTETEATVEIQPSLYDTYIPTTDIVNPPSVVANVNDASVYSALTGTKLPSTTLYYLNSDLDITTPDGSTVIASLASALTKTAGKIIPALYIKDKATADALTAFALEAALQDAFIVADDPDLLKYARDKNTNFYGVLYTKLTTAATKADLADMVANTNKGWGKIVMVDADYVSKDDVTYMQKRLMNVWVIGDMDNYGVYENISKGVNGIVSTDPAQTIYVLETFNTGTPTIVREPFMYAHRGYCTVANQNTMPAFYAAVDNGADLIEMDIRITSDGVVVLYHDEYLYTLTNCEDTTKKVENVTYEELMTYEVDNLSAYGIANAKIPTLREFLELIDQAAETTDIVGIVEIKNYDLNLVDQAAAIIKEMGVEEHVVSICFGQAYCERMRNQLPGVSVGWLANAVSSNTTASSIISYAKGWIMEGNLTYHPNYTQILGYSTNVFVENVIEVGAQRGITYQPWTFYEAKYFDKSYVSGIQGLTLDDLTFDDGYVRKLEAGIGYTLVEGQATAVQALGHTSLGHDVYNCIVKRTGGANITFTTSGGLTTASGTGAATVLLMYQVTTNNAGSYYVVSAPTTITVSSSADQTTATSDYRMTLLPAYVEKWTNVMTNYSMTVTREGRGEVLTNDTGSWPAVKHACGIYASLDDSIEYDITVGSNLSIVVALSDGTYYQLQKYFEGDNTFNGDDLVGNGARFTGSVKLSDMIPASSATNGEIVIDYINVFNVGNAGDEVVIRRLDLVEQVPALISLLGDVDNNGVVETADARLIISASVGTASLTYKQAEAGDVTYDSTANSSDARTILKMIVG